LSFDQSDPKKRKWGSGIDGVDELKGVYIIKRFVHRIKLAQGNLKKVEAARDCVGLALAHGVRLWASLESDEGDESNVGTRL
jgi:hypothetical protein